MIYLPSAFCGMGLYNLVIETITENLNLLLQHYNTDSVLGITITTTLDNLQFELGIRGCPLNYDYDTWSGLATNSWIKSLWEKVDKLGIKLELEYKSILLPREKDVCTMEHFVALGIRGDLLAQINKFRKVQEAFFVSSITAANGRSIKSNCITDWRDSHETDLGKHRSKYLYGREYTTKKIVKDGKSACPGLHCQTPPSSNP